MAGQPITLTGSGIAPPPSPGYDRVQFVDGSGQVAASTDWLRGQVIWVPAGLSGAYTLRILDEDGTQILIASAGPLTVTAPTATATPSVSISPANAVAGEGITLTGTGITPPYAYNGYDVVQFLDGSGQDAAQAQWSFGYAVSVPWGLAGTYTLRILDQTQTQVLVASAGPIR